MLLKRIKRSKNPKPSDWLQVGLDGGMFLLGIVQDISSLAPIPYLSVAAGLTIKIVEAVQVSDISLSSHTIYKPSVFLQALQG